LDLIDERAQGLARRLERLGGDFQTLLLLLDGLE